MPANTVACYGSHAVSRACPSLHRRVQRRSLCVVAAGNKQVLIIGGTGRVGSSAASAILKSFPDVDVTVASRSQASYEQAVKRRPELRKAIFRACDINDASAVKEALKGVDLVIHAAGPFQQCDNHSVLESAVAARVAYLDVSDDTTYSEASKARYHAAAQAAGVPAVISGGIYPGTSNVMAAHIISIARKEYDEEFKHRPRPPGEGMDPKLLRYSYYTAGSGGAGPTILETTLLLAGEAVTVYKDGAAVELPGVSNRRDVDFGPPVGHKGTWLYNLPEVASAHKYLGVPGVSARFSTDPFFWNWAMWLIARLLPPARLRDRAFVKALAKLSDPFVRAVDGIVGEGVAMKVEVDFDGGKSAAGIYYHRKLSDAMGYSLAAFAQALLTGGTQPGVWYPEQAEAITLRRQFLQTASTGATRFVLNKPAWQLESEVKQVIGMVYW